MRNIRKGDIVGRKSYGKDIYFKVVNIIEIKNDKYYRNKKRKSCYIKWLI